MKNRNGATGDTLHYAYYSMFNKFLDMDSAMAEARQDNGVYPVTQVDADGRVSNPEK